MSVIDSDVRLIARRYAEALFAQAQQEKNVDKVEADLADLEKALEDSPEFTRLIADPRFSREEVARALEAIITKMQLNDITRRFVLVLNRNRRLAALPLIINAFGDLCRKARGVMLAEIVSAQVLSKDRLRKLTPLVEKMAGGPIELKVREKPELLGGLIVRVGGRMIDNSLKARLDALSAHLKRSAESVVA